MIRQAQAGARAGEGERAMNGDVNIITTTAAGAVSGDWRERERERETGSNK